MAKRAPIPKECVIPEDILIPAANRATLEFKCCSDNWTELQLDELRHWLPPKWASTPRDYIRRQAGNLRRRDMLVSVDGHGPPKRDAVSPELEAYYKSTQWKRLRQQVLEYWGNRCSICYHPGGLDVHHRTYARLYRESLTDVIPLCPKCHAIADSRRKREDMENRGQCWFGESA